MKATGVESTEKAIWFEIIRIAEGEIHRHLDKVVRGAVEEVLNRLLEEKGAKLAGAERYERREQRRDYRNGRRKRKLMAKAGEVKLSDAKIKAFCVFPGDGAEEKYGALGARG